MNMRIFLCIALCIVLANTSETLQAQTQRVEKATVWSGRNSKGQPISVDELEKIVQKHKEWIESDKQVGQRANLQGAYLAQADLNGVNLKEASLKDVDLQGANLENAIFHNTDLRGSHLNAAILNGAGFRKAVLSDASLYNAEISDADFYRADLSRANLRGAKLNASYFSEAVLENADLRECNLNKAYFYRADLTSANLQNAKLNGASLSGKTTLAGANLSRADLSNAIIVDADMCGANLKEAIIEETDFSGTDMSNTLFEPKSETLPMVARMVRSKNLHFLRYIENSAPLMKLRQEFKKDGFVDKEKEIVYAIKRSRMKRLWDTGDCFDKARSLCFFALFDLTCRYGLSPERPLMILCFFLFLFSIPYMMALRYGNADGIWKVWSDERVRTDLGEEKPRLLRVKGYHVITNGLYFSLLTTFNFGWGVFKFGSWIARLNPREYTLSGTGWVRTVSGFQSVISLYLMILWISTFFGKPLE